MVEGVKKVERVKGIEPSYAAWEAAVLPLNYTRFEAVEPSLTLNRLERTDVYRIGKI